MVLDIAVFRPEEGGDPEKIRELQKKRFKVSFLLGCFLELILLSGNCQPLLATVIQKNWQLSGKIELWQLSGYNCNFVLEC